MKVFMCLLVTLGSTLLKANSLKPDFSDSIKIANLYVKSLKPIFLDTLDYFDTSKYSQVISIDRYYFNTHVLYKGRKLNPKKRRDRKMLNYMECGPNDSIRIDWIKVYFGKDGSISHIDVYSRSSVNGEIERLGKKDYVFTQYADGRSYRVSFNSKETVITVEDNQLVRPLIR